MHMLFNQFDDWIACADLGLDAARRTGDRPAQAELLESLGMAHAQRHELALSAGYHQSALELRRALGDATAEALSLNDLGLLNLRMHRLDTALEMFDRARTVLDGTGGTV
ncbi:tetratricopeptide repeat protein [Actinomadura parmotrematis]|uniref:Tetratricopeptide repeat protein n=1 Tax=Actinomadura parmotrematis TaxID=2864039 RepID=A0ABS7FZU1_9ACTN|nr:tetratricopeptide repeat protein [Actinomadura parmotrematis]MBW8485968.1 tetratricopeptide repeat protein [Actinomadura parmotrematis]